jgi:hypothetical protein
MGRQSDRMQQEVAIAGTAGVADGTVDAPSAETHIVLWLDLADANQANDTILRKYLPPGAHVLKLSEHGGSPCLHGTPAHWPPVLDAIELVVANARALERQASGTCRYWVTGRAGLPAMVYAGFLLSAFATVTMLHQNHRTGELMEVPLDASLPVARPYLQCRPSPIAVSHRSGPVLLIVASEYDPPDTLILRALGIASDAADPPPVFRARSDHPIDRHTAVAARHEVARLVRSLCDAHPERSCLALFVAGPSVLAFLTGLVVNPRVCRDVRVFEFDGERYNTAYELPYPAVPDCNTVVVLQSLPAGHEPLALAEEIRAVQREQAGLVASRLELKVVPNARARDLSRLLREERPGVLHFSGHGESGALMFEDPGGDSRPLPTSDLVESLRLAGDSVRLVVLSACDSDSHQALLAHVDCLVVMRGRIYDEDAIRFAAALYRHLDDGDSVQTAFDNARLEVRLARPASRAGLARDVEPMEPAPGQEPAQEAEEPLRLLERYPGIAARRHVLRRRR